MLKYIVTDLDGTFIYGNKVSDKNKKAVKLIENKGLEFIIATGRSYVHTLGIYDDLGIQYESILLNGSCFLNKEGKFEKLKIISKEEIEISCHILLKNRLGIVVYTKNKVIAYKISKRQLIIEHGNVHDNDYDFISEFLYKDLYEIDSLVELMIESPLKIEVMNIDTDLIDKCYIELAVLGINVVKTSDFCIEITGHKVSKGEAMLEICKQRGINKEEVVVFGDSGNDVSLFVHFPNAFAMANSNNQLKEIAKFHCRACQDDGFYEKIVEIFQGKE